LEKRKVLSKNTRRKIQSRKKTWIREYLGIHLISQTKEDPPNSGGEKKGKLEKKRVNRNCNSTINNSQLGKGYQGGDHWGKKEKSYGGRRRVVRGGINPQCCQQSME